MATEFPIISNMNFSLFDIFRYAVILLIPLAGLFFVYILSKHLSQKYKISNMDFSLLDILLGIFRYAVILLIPLAGLFLVYILGKHLSQKYRVARWYFCTAYLFAVPVIAAPFVLFGSMFMDHVKHEFLAPVAWVLINTYAMWLVLGFVCSMKLYDKMPRYISILPSPLSWIFAVGAILGGILLVSF